MPTTEDARARLEALIEETATSHHPILIRGNGHNAVLLSEADWHNITDTLRLLSTPSIRESLRKALDGELEVFLETQRTHGRQE